MSNCCQSLVVPTSLVAADTVQGPVGPQGPAGTNGNGIQSTSYNPATGVLTLTFTDATTYSTGDLRGSAGAAGSTGAAGVGIASATINGSGELVITYTNAVVQNLGVIQGPAGPAGATGPQGPAGASGIETQNDGVTVTASAGTLNFTPPTVPTQGQAATWNVSDNAGVTEISFTGDNLGNHDATTDLKIGNHKIVSARVGTPNEIHFPSVVPTWTDPVVGGNITGNATEQNAAGAMFFNVDVDNNDRVANSGVSGNTERIFAFGAGGASNSVNYDSIAVIQQIYSSTYAAGSGFFSTYPKDKRLGINVQNPLRNLHVNGITRLDQIEDGSVVAPYPDEAAGDLIHTATSNVLRWRNEDKLVALGQYGGLWDSGGTGGQPSPFLDNITGLPSNPTPGEYIIKITDGAGAAELWINAGFAVGHGGSNPGWYKLTLTKG